MTTLIWVTIILVGAAGATLTLMLYSMKKHLDILWDYARSLDESDRALMDLLILTRTECRLSDPSTPEKES